MNVAGLECLGEEKTRGWGERLLFVYVVIVTEQLTLFGEQGIETVMASNLDDFQIHVAKCVHTCGVVNERVSAVVRPEEHAFFGEYTGLVAMTGDLHTL